MRTRAQVEHLKLDWLDDPCWDIEETEGYENYKDELRIFRENQEFKWQQEKQKRHDILASKFCPMGFSNSVYNQSCVVEKCAWWDNEHESCAMKSLTTLIKDVL